MCPRSGSTYDCRPLSDSRLARLRCPDCTNALVPHLPDVLVCSSCHRSFLIAASVPVLRPSTLHPITTAEITYWDERAERERKGLADHYAADRLAVDSWGLYGYADDLKRLPRDAAILEVGSGTAPKTVFLARYQGFQDVTVSDLSAAQLRVNREECARIGLTDAVSHVAADSTALPFGNETFDAVLIHSALHHVPDQQTALREMVRCLRPGGVLIIGHEPNRLMIRLARSVAEWTHLGEKHQDSCYSVADDELEGLNLAEVSQSLKTLGIEISRVDRQWFVMACIHPIPLVVRRLSGRTVRVPAAVVRCAAAADRALRRVPIANRAFFHFSVVGHTRAA
jgi:SAM-dependent methyltransferase/uncharacterized protein YbaR (Trm112 family)